MAIVSMKALLESGVHFGHQTRRWNPRMSQYIFIARGGIHIIDLQKTMQFLKIAYNAMKELAGSGAKVLFVGTKKQAKAAIKEYAEKCNMPYIAERWPGGLLTNFNTVKKSIQRLKDLEEMNKTGVWDAETKKEVLELNRELAKKSKILSGIKDMNKLPDALFVIDPKKEAIAVNEAIKLGIPIFAVVDTNCNPDNINYPIPGNDDAIRAIGVFLDAMTRAINEGNASRQVDEDLEKQFTDNEKTIEVKNESIAVNKDTKLKDHIEVKEEAKESNETVETADVEGKTVENIEQPAAKSEKADIVAAVKSTTADEDVKEEK